MRARLAALAVLIALAATALVVAGCGATLDPVAQAATRTAGVSTLRFTMRMKVQTPTAATPVTLTATGAIDSAAQRLELKLDLSKLAATGDEQAGSGL